MKGPIILKTISSLGTFSSEGLPWITLFLSILLVSLMNETIFGKSYLDIRSFERLDEGLFKRSPKNQIFFSEGLP